MTPHVHPSKCVRKRKEKTLNQLATDSLTNRPLASRPTDASETDCARAMSRPGMLLEGQSTEQLERVEREMGPVWTVDARRKSRTAV